MVRPSRFERLLLPSQGSVLSIERRAQEGFGAPSLPKWDGRTLGTITRMDLKDYEPLEGDALKEKIRSLSRSSLDEQIRQFGAQYANLCQRLEALYTPDRIDQFIAIRPGGLDDIDQAIQAAGKNARE